MFKELPIHRTKYGLMRTIIVNVLQAYAESNAKVLDIKASYALGNLKTLDTFAEYKRKLIAIKEKESELLLIRSRYNSLDLGLKTTTAAERLHSDVTHLEAQINKERKYLSIIEKKKRVKLKIRLTHSIKFFNEKQNTQQALDAAILETQQYNSKKQWVQLFEALTNLKYDNL